MSYLRRALVMAVTVGVFVAILGVCTLLIVLGVVHLFELLAQRALAG